MIQCDIQDWPIVRMHFHNYPHYDEVIHWLNDCDSLLKRKIPFLLISTFEAHYQFTHDARKKQAVWFKTVKNDLAKYCLGMFRVTEDPTMIAKLQSPAMRKGMPFQCIAVRDVVTAYQQAHKLLQQHGL
ncbi:MAG: hypothetical protein O2809_00470 [Proteobacteria bacterium]|nr:hypothetical protein [Pseudomonadota bacterium]